MCRRPLTAAVLAALAAGAAAAPSSAATLHATPDSTRAATPCAVATPCKLDYAMAAAGVGDDVRLAPGDYYATGTTPYAGLPDVRPGITVHGDPALPLPVLHGHMAANATPFVRIQSTGVLRDVALDVGSNPGLTYSYAVMITPGALLDRALVRSRGTTGVNTTACSMVGGTVTNSACLGSGPGTVNALTGTASASVIYAVRNVTAITTATSGDGIRVGVSSFTSTMNVTNSIARGITSDVASRAGLAGGDVTLNLTNSNWNAQSSGGAGTARIINVGGNQYGPTAAVPLFADAAAGDYRPVAGSPTIDAGTTDPLNGPLALGGAPRVVGAATDIGAFECVPPPPAPPAPPAPTT
ncbi:MAG: hypothetical protein JHC84_21145, partial [Solirubrobacteraceae bacterium]|nr:hypothetical protein [Solirubrobacteraceae bacterium]